MFILFWFHEIIWKLNFCIFLSFSWSSLLKAYLKGASKRSLFLLSLNEFALFLIYFEMTYYRLHYRSHWFISKCHIRGQITNNCADAGNSVLYTIFFERSFCMFLTLHLFLRKLKESMKKRNIWNILFKWLYKNRCICQP